MAKKSYTENTQREEVNAMITSPRTKKHLNRKQYQFQQVNLRIYLFLSVNNNLLYAHNLLNVLLHTIHTKTGCGLVAIV